MACDSPITVFPKYYDKNGASDHNRSYGVPCGKCAPCKENRIAGWRTRLYEEEKVSINAYFITLTYDTQTVPISSRGFMSLNPEHLTKFFKQLRNLQNRQKKIPKGYPKIKYYACGEYGEQKKRPHYHAILFNIYDPLDITKAWAKGKVDVRINDGIGAMAYTAGYISKDPMPKYICRQRDIIPEFSRMSQKLGVSYTTDKANLKWHLADIENRCYITDKGIKYPMPQYYKKKIYKKWQREKIARHAQEIAQQQPEYNDTDLEIRQKIGRTNQFNAIQKLKPRE